MSRDQFSRGSFSRLLALVLSAALLSLTPAAAFADEPSSVEKTVALSSPGVVFMQTSVRLKARIQWRSYTTASGLSQATRTYRFDYSTGSGFTVAPDGTIVTASHVVEPSRQQMRNYAANRLVLDSFDYTYDSPFTQYRVSDGYINRLLQQCYRGVACKIAVTPLVNVYTGVQIADKKLANAMPARVLTSTGFDATDVAVVKVDGTNMPTVPLAETADVQSGDEITAMGFPGSARDLPTGLTEPTKLFGQVSNVRSIGSSKQIEVDADLEPGMSGGPVVNAEGEVIGLTSYGRLQSSGQSAQSYLRSVDDIRLAMNDAGVEASRGLVDTKFSSAMDLYWNDHYSAAIPVFQEVLNLQDGHPLATQYLAESQAEAGGPNDVPVAKPEPKEKPKEGVPTTLVIAIAAGVLVVVVGGLWIRSRKRRSTPAPVAPVEPVAEMRAEPIGVPTATAVAQPAVEATTQTSEHSESDVTAAVPFQAAEFAARSEGQPLSGVAENGAASEGAVDDGKLAVANRRFCEQCGTGLNADARFCSSCGAAV
jgi:serine protease Do